MSAGNDREFIGYLQARNWNVYAIKLNKDTVAQLKAHWGIIELDINKSEAIFRSKLEYWVRQQLGKLWFREKLNGTYTEMLDYKPTEPLVSLEIDRRRGK